MVINEQIRVGVEGIGGSGKTHFIQELLSRIIEMGYSAGTYKISGMGGSPRVQLLSEINRHREQQLRNGNATTKVLEDKMKDRIFRLATQHQVRQFLTDDKSQQFDAVLVDRTPLMPWVYAASHDETNPYLIDIFDDGLKNTKVLRLNIILLLNVEATTAYARIFARMCAGLNEEEVNKNISELMAHIGGTRLVEAEIIKKTQNQLLLMTNLLKKPLAVWDFIPYVTMVKETENYVKILEYVQQHLSLPFVVLNAEQDIEQVVEDAMKLIVPLLSNK